MPTASSSTSTHRDIELQLLVTKMSEVSHGHQANDPVHNEEHPLIQSPARESPASVKLNAQEAPTIPSDTEASPANRKSKASTFSALSLNPPRRPALSPNTFDPNATPYRHVSSGASHPTTQLSQDSLIHPTRRASAASTIRAPEQSFIDQKENQRVSPELKKQLESLIAPASRTTSQSSRPSTVSKDSKFGGWSIGKSSIAIRPSEPVANIITTELWEPPASAPEASPEGSESDQVHTPISMSGYQSEYVSFPPFESYPKNPRPGLRSRCSDKSWHLLQKLKGKIVEIHNAGLQSSRSSSRNSISSRKSRSPGRPLRENQPPRTRPASESGGSRTRLDVGPSTRSRHKAATISGGTLRTSASNLKRVSIAELNATSAEQTNTKIRSSTHQATIVAVAPDTELQNQQRTPEAHKEPSGLSSLTRPLELASSIFQSLVTIASGDTPKSTPVSPDRGSVSDTNNSKSPSRIPVPKTSLAKGQTSQPSNEDSSEDEMSFMQYIKRFSDSSPTGAPKRPLFSTTSYDTSTEVKPELSITAKQAIPRTVTFKGPSYDDIRRATPMSPIQEANSNDEIPPEIALDPDTGKALIKYTAEDYDTITTYFYNTQARVLKQKWPFLYENEIKYLIDNKWLEMEWEDLEDWAQESAQHIDDEGYVEPDLFEDLTLVDPRSLKNN
ncbi:hypothetical protein TWF281_006141 [Arthrobotrys megalospora]